jgi:hypothetical protein
MARADAGHFPTLSGVSSEEPNDPPQIEHSYHHWGRQNYHKMRSDNQAVVPELHFLLRVLNVCRSPMLPINSGLLQR